MILRLLFALVLSLAPALAFAQEAKPEPKVPPFTELEKLKLGRFELLSEIERLQSEVLTWRRMALEALDKLGPYETAQTKQENREALAKVIAELEKARPGFKFDLASGQFKSLPKAEEPKAEEKKKEK